MLVCEEHEKWVEIHTHVCAHNAYYCFKKPQKCTNPVRLGFDFAGNLILFAKGETCYTNQKNQGIITAFEQDIYKAIVNKDNTFTKMMCEELKKWDIIITPKLS